MTLSSKRYKNNEHLATSLDKSNWRWILKITDQTLLWRQIIIQSKNSLIIQGKDKMALGYTDHRRPFLNTFAQMTKTISRPGFLNKMEYLKDMVFIKEYHVIMVYVP